MQGGLTFIQIGNWAGGLFPVATCLHFDSEVRSNSRDSSSGEDSEDKEIADKEVELINTEIYKDIKFLTVKWICDSQEETDEYTYDENMDDTAWKLSGPGEIITISD